MTSRTPSSHFEKNPVAKWVEAAYPSVRNEVARLVETHASPEFIRTSLIEHVAKVNPKLAAEIMQAPTEWLVLRTIWDFAGFGEKNNQAFAIEAANEERYRDAA
jgi:hypothetical protein